MRYLPYKFTAKEQDEETWLYYYGARYLDAKYSRWLSTDPAVGEYIPQAPVNDEARKHNQQLPGQGGIFNIVNLQLYHYAGNNPVKYTDPDGESMTSGISKLISGSTKTVIGTAGMALCTLASMIIIADDATGVLIVDDVALLATVSGTVFLGMYTSNGVKETSEGAMEVIDDAKSLLDTVKQSIINSKSKKAHEDQTYGKIRSEIENKLGRRLTKEEQRDWHTEMGNIKSRKAAKGEKNPSLTEDELREAANDALDLN